MTDNFRYPETRATENSISKSHVEDPPSPLPLPPDPESPDLSSRKIAKPNDRDNLPRDKSISNTFHATRCVVDAYS